MPVACLYETVSAITLGRAPRIGGAWRHRSAKIKVGCARNSRTEPIIVVFACRVAALASVSRTDGLKFNYILPVSTVMNNIGFLQRQAQPLDMRGHHAMTSRSLSSLARRRPSTKAISSVQSEIQVKKQMLHNRGLLYHTQYISWSACSPMQHAYQDLDLCNFTLLDTAAMCTMHSIPLIRALPPAEL